jgi:uncharacterized membrane protein
MKPENNRPSKFYKGIFYFDYTTNKLFIPDPNTNRMTFNYANKWSYPLTILMVLFAIYATICRFTNRWWLIN